MIIIGLTGYIGSGKDTTGAALVKNHGFTRVSFADKVREVALAVDPIVAVQDNATARRIEPATSAGYPAGIYFRLSTVVGKLGWDEAKKIPDVRRMLQRLGTEGGRNILGENVWVEAAFRSAPKGDIAVTDVRFPNEASAIWERDGVLWRIERVAAPRSSNHPSETQIDNIVPDLTLSNNGTIEDLERLVASELQRARSEAMRREDDLAAAEDAAPDLLEALKSIVSDLDGQREYMPSHLESHLYAARAALRRAVE